MVRLEDDIAAAAAIAAGRAALGSIRLAQKSHAAFAAVARSRMNSYLINKHQQKRRGLHTSPGQLPDKFLGADNFGFRLRFDIDAAAVFVE